MDVKETGKNGRAKKLLAGMVSAGIVFWGGADVYASENIADEFTLDQVLVTAQRYETRDLDTPAAVDVITEKDLRDTGARTVFDALSFIPGITNFSYGPGGIDYGAMDSRVNLRGFERSALILINGAPINLNNKNSLDGIMIDHVERIEVVKGASSTLYGAEAFGGVVNIITKKGGPERIETSITAGNQGFQKYTGSYMSGKARFSYSKQYFGAQEQTSPKREDRGYFNNRSKGDKANYALSLNLTDDLNLSYMRSEANSTYGQVQYNKTTVDENLKNSKDYHYEDDKNSLNLIYDDKKSDLKAILFYNDRDLYGETRNKKELLYVENSSNYKAYNVGMDTQKLWEMRDGKDSLLLGMLVSKDKYKGTSTSNSGLKADRENYALYAQYTWRMTPRFTTIVGMREQIIEDMVKDQNVFLPQVQALYKVNESQSWYANIGKAFQMPALSDSMKKVSGQYEAVSGKNLKPQEGWNYEMGYKIINRANAWKFALYQMDFKNMFAWEKDDTGLDIRVNKGKFKNTGFETEFTAFLNEDWKSNVGFSYSNPRNQDTSSGEWMQTYPKFQLSAGVQYEKEKLSASVACNWLTKRLKNRDGGTNPDLVNLNAMLNYRMDDDNALNVNLNNILDRKNVITNGDWEYWDIPFNWSVSYTHSF